MSAGVPRSHGEAGGVHATSRFAQYVADLCYEDLPPALVELLKQCVLDTLGVSIAASSLAPEARTLRDYVSENGGKAVSTLWGFGGKAPPAAAAFVNGSLGHMVDYDDVGAGGHVSIVTIPVAFALAEQLGRVSGRDFLTAIAAGTDLHTRLNAGIRIPDWTISEGWFPTQLFGYLSGAATAAKLRRFAPASIENAFGIAFTQMGGSRQMAVGEATHLRSMQAGFSGQGAILAADLAGRGIVGSKAVLEGRYGLYKTYVRCEPDWNAVLGGLGRDFPLLDLHGFKVWPACGYTRPTNTAIRYLREKHALRAEDVESLAVIGGTGATRLLCEPLDSKRRPRLAIDGKFSIPFTSAVMMVRGNVTLRDYTDSGLADPAVLAMADKVIYRDDPGSELPVGGHSALSRPTVEITMSDGAVYTHRPDGVPGDPRHPVGADLLEAKFRDCVSFSARPVADADVERAIELVRHLDELDDVAAVVRLLAGDVQR
jgi:2-methylcitrate dehydratase PrpD